MPPKAHITHKIEGRTRLRIPSRRGDTGYFHQLADRLKSLSGIHEVTANPTTGSVLMHHEEDPELMQQVLSLRLFNIVPAEVAELNPNLTLQLAEKLKTADRAVRTATLGRLDLNGAMIVGLAAAGGYQMLRGAVLPAAGTLFWYAFGLAWLRPPKTPEPPR